jgi:arylsulfatase A-like enzyme
MSTRPNVIVIMTDDQGFGDLGCHGNPVASTPHLDALHGESARLVDFHVAPMCTPTRGQLLTGLDAARTGAVNVCGGRTMLRPELPTIADHFVKSGYRTGLFGKWHLGNNYPYRPQDRGFQDSLWFPSSMITSAADYWYNDYFDDVYRRNDVPEQMTGYCTEVFFREATEWISRCIEADEPFFAYLPTNAPHHPLFAPKADLDHAEAAFAAGEHLLGDYDRAQRDDIVRFLAMIHNVDTEIGHLREFLATAGVADDTVLVFLTDNGSTFGPGYFNAGMRGGKTTLWEGGHRVPCFIHWPAGGLDRGSDVGGLTQVQDIVPTLADWCGLEVTELDLDGVSLDPVLRRGAQSDPDRVLFVNYSRLTFNDYPAPTSPSILRRDGTAVLWRHWRHLPGVGLYDLENDPLQAVDVSSQHPEVVERLETALDGWWARVEPIANVPQYVVVGHASENPTHLTSADWWDVTVDTRWHICNGPRINSYWNIDVAQAGDYRFTLRRWPEEAGLGLSDPAPAGVLPDDHLTPGVALPIAGARLCIESHDVSVELSPTDRCAEFTVTLEAGRTQLCTWFYDPQGQALAGAYFVEAKLVSSAAVRPARR